jgi:hypothetical protein
MSSDIADFEAARIAVVERALQYIRESAAERERINDPDGNWDMLRAAYGKIPPWSLLQSGAEPFSAFRQFCNSRLGKYQRARDRHISRAHELRGAQAARTRLAREEKLGVADNDEQWANSSTSDWGGNEGWGTGEGWESGKWYIDTAEATQCGRHQWEICPSLEITHGEEISPLLLPVHLGYPKIVPLHL